MVMVMDSTGREISDGVMGLSECSRCQGRLIMEWESVERKNNEVVWLI